MNTCELYKTMKKLASEQGKPFPQNQPEVCESCPENDCQIIDDRLLFDANVVSPSENDIAESVDTFTGYVVGQKRMERFYGMLKKHQIIYQNTQ